MALYPEFQRLIDSGEYSSVEEMCNHLCLNYDEVYDYSDEEDVAYTDYMTITVNDNYPEFIEQKIKRCYNKQKLICERELS